MFHFEHQKTVVGSCLLPMTDTFLYCLIMPLQHFVAELASPTALLEQFKCVSYERQIFQIILVRNNWSWYAM